MIDPVAVSVSFLFISLSLSLLGSVFGFMRLCYKDKKSNSKLNFFSTLGNYMLRFSEEGRNWYSSLNDDKPIDLEIVLPSETKKEDDTKEEKLSEEKLLEEKLPEEKLSEQQLMDLLNKIREQLIKFNNPDFRNEPEIAKFVHLRKILKNITLLSNALINMNEQDFKSFSKVLDGFSPVKNEILKVAVPSSSS